MGRTPPCPVRFQPVCCLVSALVRVYVQQLTHRYSHQPGGCEMLRFSSATVRDTVGSTSEAARVLFGIANVGAVEVLVPV